MSHQGYTSQDRLRELILYVVDHCRGDASFCATKLNKILFYSDFWAYTDGGSSITGLKYTRVEGVPVPVGMDGACAQLCEDGRLAFAPNGRSPGRPLVTREGKSSALPAHQLSLVDEVIEMLWQLEAADVTSFPMQLQHV